MAFALPLKQRIRRDRCAHADELASRQIDKLAARNSRFGEPF